MGDTPSGQPGPHRRYDPLLEEWVLVSAERTSRPWQGGRDAVASSIARASIPSAICAPEPLAPMAPRIRRTTPPTSSPTTSPPSVPTRRPAGSRIGLLISEGEAGTCRVVCFSPRHDLTLAQMDVGDVRGVVDLWAAETTDLGRAYRWVQVFENRGEAMGASNPHPHGQIWAGTAMPRIAAREDATQAGHLSATGRRLLLDYAAQEHAGPRVVVEDEDWLIVVPFWASWPFETLVIAKRPASRLADLDDAARDALAADLIDAAAAVRHPVRGAVPVFDGLAPGAVRARADGSLAVAWALLSAPATFGDRPQVHGRLRAARRGPAGHHTGGCRRTPQIAIAPDLIAGMISVATARRTSRSPGAGRTVVKSVNPSARWRRTNSR